MSDWSNRFTLINAIIEKSNSNKWEEAKLEWSVKNIYKFDDWEYFETCLCWHYPIKEICELENKLNWKNTIVWNVCVNKFLDVNLNTNKIFQAVNRVLKDNKKSFNIETINYFYNKDILTLWENEFYTKIIKKRNLSEKQINIKIKINEKILKELKKV